MKYAKVIEGVFLSRPNRFIAQVLIDGEEETVHVKNTGRCRELLVPGARVVLEDSSHNKNRKTKYSLIAVWKDQMLVNMDSQVPNAVVFDAMNAGEIRGFEDLIFSKREVTFGKSRYDIYFETKDRKGFMEVKGVTLENNGICKFPDAPTERGTKHVLEMIEVVEEGYVGVIMFLVQMKGPKVFRVNEEMDPAFANAVRRAYENGVEILAYDAYVESDEIRIGEEITIDLS